MSKATIQPSAENPEELLDLKVTEPKKWAAGIPAVMASGSDMLQGPGFVRGMEGLFHMNKKGGFDCSGCAWPDPDDDRSPIAEYCENGAYFFIPTYSNTSDPFSNNLNVNLFYKGFEDYLENEHYQNTF